MLRQAQESENSGQAVKVFYDERIPIDSEHPFFKPLPKAPSAKDNEDIRGFFPKTTINTYISILKNGLRKDILGIIF